MAAREAARARDREPEALMPVVELSDSFNPPLAVAVPTRPRGGWRGVRRGSFGKAAAMRGWDDCGGPTASGESRPDLLQGAALGETLDDRGRLFHQLIAPQCRARSDQPCAAWPRPEPHPGSPQPQSDRRASRGMH